MQTAVGPYMRTGLHSTHSTLAIYTPVKKYQVLVYVRLLRVSDSDNGHA